MAKRKTTPSRSEQIRARRASAKTPRLKQRGKKTPAPVAPRRDLPPVVVRAGKSAMAQPERKRKRKAPRRRYDIAVGGVPGTAISLPAVPSVHLGWRALSLILTALLGGLLYHLWSAPVYRVQSVALQGNTYLTPEIVNRALAVSGDPIFAISPRALERELHKAFPGLLLEASVRVGLPAQVYVTVAEREPALVWEQDGETLWVDVDGYAFAPAGENPGLITVSAETAPPALFTGPEPPAETETPQAETDPLVEILSPKPFLSPEMVAGILRFRALRPKDDLTYTAAHGFGWHDQKRDWDVYFGLDLSNVDEKLTVYRAIKAHLRENGIPAVLVSVEHIHAPYYRLEP